MAYQRHGQGPPIVRIPSLPLVLRAQPLLGQSPDSLDSHRQHRSSPGIHGTGMSDSPVTDMSVEAWAADAEAIIEAVGPPLPVYASSLEGSDRAPARVPTSGPGVASDPEFNRRRWPKSWPRFRRTRPW